MEANKEALKYGIFHHQSRNMKAMREQLGMNLVMGGSEGFVNRMGSAAVVPSPMVNEDNLMILSLNQSNQNMIGGKNDIKSHLEAESIVARFEDYTLPC